MKHIFLVCLFSLLAACGSFQSVTQTEESTYLQLEGNPAGVQLKLDDTHQLDLERDTTSFDLNGKTITKIIIQPGRHRVTLTRNQQLLVDREFYVSEGNGFEVKIP
ncbi:MAG: hypothetical protein VYA55_08205 [Pseudomonadota bacterium]|nr:hypothetical protein [Pseudomonadota bacterium]